MKRRNYTREILKEIEKGRVAICSIGPARAVTYQPRSKSDPQPWTCGIYRYSGRFVHTVAHCYGWVFMESGRPAECNQLDGHGGDCTPKA